MPSSSPVRRSGHDPRVRRSSTSSGSYAASSLGVPDSLGLAPHLRSNKPFRAWQHSGSGVRRGSRAGEQGDEDLGVGSSTAGDGVPARSGLVAGDGGSLGGITEPERGQSGTEHHPVQVGFAQGEAAVAPEVGHPVGDGIVGDRAAVTGRAGG
jgi:hypothetical protein